MNFLMGGVHAMSLWLEPFESLKRALPNYKEKNFFQPERMASPGSSPGFLSRSPNKKRHFPIFQLRFKMNDYILPDGRAAPASSMKVAPLRNRALTLEKCPVPVPKKTRRIGHGF